MELEVVDPSSGKQVGTFTATTKEEVDAGIATARVAQKAWAEVSPKDRAAMVHGLAKILRDRSDELAELMTREMGKVLAEAESEVEKCAWVCEYYGEHGPGMLESRTVESDGDKSYVAHRPLGTLLAVMPWNFPFWQLFRFAAPALTAGNGVVLKHAANVPGCALAIESVIRSGLEDGGYDPHLFKTLLIPSDEVEAVISDPRIQGVTLTGSTAAGRAVAEIAGKQLKKTVLELGGSDPYVILADADIESAAEACVESRLINNGQSCIAAKRFIVVSEVREAFEQAVLERMEKVKLGDPRKEGTDLGPMAREDLRETLHEQVTKSVEKGAKLRLGGEIPDRKGFYYPATLLTDVEPGMPAFDEELFGPAAALIEARDEEEAAKFANATPYGLGAAVFSKDLERAETWARDRLEAGCCFVNDYVRSDPRLPFGGIKDSGYGRELSNEGILEWVNSKTVWIRRV